MCNAKCETQDFSVLIHWQKDATPFLSLSVCLAVTQLKLDAV